MQFEDEFFKVSQLIKQKNKILLASHERPDGDALGSMIAMFSVLRRFEGKEIIMFSKDFTPPHLEFLPYQENIIHDMSSPATRSYFKGEGPDLFLAFDYGDFSRLGVDSKFLKDAVIVTFDHHPFFKQKGEISIIDPFCSSTCELLYHFFCSEKYKIFPKTATALLAGIFTDTGGFAHINTSVKTLQAVGDLLRYGTSIKNLHRHTFSNKSPDNLRVWGAILKNIMQEKAVGMAYVTVPFDRFEQLGSSLDSFEGIVNIINTPPSVRFALMLVEYKPGSIKGSLRSEAFKEVDVSKIARALGGGGHKYAAGFDREGETLKNVVEYVKRVATEVI